MKSKKTIRLMVVDDHPVFRKGLTALIADEPDLQVIADIGDGREAVDLYRHVRPDVVLMDLRLPGFSGVEAIQSILKEFPDGRIIVLTTFDTDEDVYRAIHAGAKAYLLKDMVSDEIFDAIRTVYQGKTIISSRVAGHLEERQKRAELTSGQLEVLELLVRGLSNKEIADKLGLSEPAVKSRLRGLFQNLHVLDRTEAVIYAVQHGIINL